MRAETQRVRQAYRRRDTAAVAGRYAPVDPANRLMVHSREMAFAKLLASEGLSHLGGKRVLEVGCGGAGELSRLVGLGAGPELLYGVDLLPERLPASSRMRSLAHLVVADGARLPFDDGSFDVVMQVTTFTSILDPDIRLQVAEDMRRVLAPGGLILWYDFFLDNPRNPDVSGVGRRELRRLFPGSDISLRRVTLAPPLARAVAPRSIVLARALEAMPLLRSHYAGVIRPRGGAAVARRMAVPSASHTRSS